MVGEPPSKITTAKQLMHQATLSLLVISSSGSYQQICLAMKKRGFGQGKWNGAGGKVAPGESIEEAMVRETKEEILVTPINCFKAAELEFNFPHRPEWDQAVHVYLVRQWVGEISESEEMKPAWYPVTDIPYAHMWPDDILWLPLVLAGEFVTARFSFNDKEEITAHHVSGHKVPQHA